MASEASSISTGKAAVARRSSTAATAATGTSHAVPVESRLAHAAVAVTVLLAAALVWLAAGHAYLAPPARFSYPGWMSGPLAPLSHFYHASGLAMRTEFTAVVVGMFACYLIVVSRAAQLRTRWLLAAIVAAHLVFFLSPPLSLTDVFNYINYGRMEIMHGLNPYVTAPVLEPHSDPSFTISNWHHLLSPYGPLFTIFTFAFVPLGVAASFWVLKGVLLLASLATLWLIWRCAELLGHEPRRAVAFVGLNPLILVWGLGGDHNDFLLILCVMLAVYLLLRAAAAGPASTESHLSALAFGAGVALAAAIAIKASAAILLPVVLLGATRRLRLLAGVVLGALVFAGASLAAFGVHLPNLSDQSRLVTALAIPNVLGFAFGSGGETDALKTAMSVVLLVSVGACALWAARSRNWITACGFATLALIATLSWTLPWYVLWLLPFAALARSRALSAATTALCIYTVIAWVPLGADLRRVTGLEPATTKLGRLHQAWAKALLH